MACFTARHLAGIQPEMNACKYMDLRSFTYHIWAYLQVCSRSSIFCRFGGCFSVSRQFLRLYSYQPLKQLWKMQKRQSRTFVTTRASGVTTPLHTGRFTGAANPRVADSQPVRSEYVSFENKDFFFPCFSVFNVCDFFQFFYKRGPCPEAECRNEGVAEPCSGRNRFVPPSLSP